MPGIMPSVAVAIVDNGFKAIGYTEQQIAQFNFPDKLSFYCDIGQLNALKTFIRTDAVGGLPSIGCTIGQGFLQDIGLSATYGKLADRVTRFSEIGGLIP